MTRGPVAADPGVCPLCQEANECAEHAAEGSCWCFAERVDSSLVSWLTARGLDGACLCRVCAAGFVASPCIGVCALDVDGTTCTGCGRTTGEIGTWSAMTPVERARVLLRLRALDD